MEDSWSNLFQMLQRGEIDLLSDVSLTEERRETMSFPDLPMGSESYYLYIDADNGKLTSDDLTTFNGRKLGVNKGSVQATYLRDWARKNGIMPQIVELTGEEADSMDMLARGELDGYVTTNTFGAKESCVPACKVGASDFYFAVNKERPDLLKELNAALTGIQDEDPYFNQKMYDEYVYITKTNAYLTPSQEDWLDKHGAIRVGYRDNYLPFCAQDKTTGELNGALRDYLTHAANSMKNAELQFEAVPYPSTIEALEEMKNGEVDCVFPVNLNSYDAELMDVLTTEPVMKTEMYAVVRKTDSRGISRSMGVTVAANAGNINLETFLKEKFPEWTVALHPDTEACLSAVAAEEADCALICNYRLNSAEDRLDRYRLNSVPTGEIMRLAFSTDRNARELFFILNKTVVLTKSEDMDIALASHVRTDERVSLLRFINDNWVVMTGFITVVFGVILFLMRQKLTAERRANERQMQINEERLARQQEQEQVLRRELRAQKQLDSAMQMAYTDPLTGVKSKHAYHAYVEAQDRLNGRIENGEAVEFGVVVFDLNDLKVINDTQGHEFGDRYIRDACKLICTRFKHSPVFRVGGDEFVALLQGEDYLNSKELLRVFDREMNENAASGGIVVSSGSARFDPKRDNSVRAVFERADERMYHRKKELKEIKRTKNSGV